MKRRAYEIKREQSLIRYLPRWMRSWEPQYLPADKMRDLEHGMESPEVHSPPMFRVELPPRYSQACPSVDIINQVDGSRSCNEIMADNPFMTGALPESCDCPVSHTIRRRKNTSPSRVVWHADSKETSRAICTQFLIPRRHMRLPVLKDVRSEAEMAPKTLSSTLERKVLRAVSEPYGNTVGPGNEENMRGSLLNSAKALGKGLLGLHELDQNRGPEGIRGLPHNTETSISHNLATSTTAADANTFKQPCEPELAERIPVIFKYHRKISQGAFGSHGGPMNPATSGIVSRGSLSGVIEQPWDSEAKASLNTSSSVHGRRQVSVSSFLSVVGHFRRHFSETLPSLRRSESSCTSQAIKDEVAGPVQSLRQSKSGALSQLDGIQHFDNPRSMMKEPKGMPQINENAKPTSSKICALTDSVIEESLQLRLWPHTVIFLSTMGSLRVSPELTIETKENVPIRISPAPGPSLLRSQKRRSPLRQYSGNADPTRTDFSSPPLTLSRVPPVEDLIIQPTNVASRPKFSRKTPSAPDQLSVGDVHQRLQWLEWELMPGLRNDIQSFPFLLDLGDPQPVIMCGATSRRIKQRTESLEDIRPQSRYSKPLPELNNEIEPADGTIVTAAWVARHPPDGLPQDPFAQDHEHYSKGRGKFGPLEGWQDPNGPKQAQGPAEVKERQQFKAPKGLKRTISRSFSVLGIVAKNSRRVGKLNVRRHRQISSDSAKTSYRNLNIGGIFHRGRATNNDGCGEQDARSARTLQPTTQRDLLIPQSDMSTLQGVEGWPVSPTLLDERELLDALSPKDSNDSDFNDSSKYLINQDVKKAIEILESQVDEEPIDFYTSDDFNKPLEPPASKRKNSGPYLEHPLSRFHESYRSAPSFHEEHSQNSVQHGNSSSPEVSAGD